MEKENTSNDSDKSADQTPTYNQEGYWETHTEEKYEEAGLTVENTGDKK